MRLSKLLLSLVPHNRYGDRIVSLYSFIRYHRRLPKAINGTFLDALYYLKTSDEIMRPLRCYISDKVHLKEYVKAKLGESYNVPTLAILKPGQVRDFNYPDRCVIKPTHMSGKVVLRQKGEPIDFCTIDQALASNHYYKGREANYRYLQSKVMVEPFIFDTQNLDDYFLWEFKIFCVKGIPKLIQANTDRQRGLKKSYYTIDWNYLDITLRKAPDKTLAKPQNLEEILQVAKMLSSDLNFIRVDLYSNSQQILVGELTNIHSNITSRFGSKQEEQLFSQILFGPEGFNLKEFQAQC